ncbi:hypothetical protein CYMTET_5137 [Cymbomonas tetramitiformis]|uniref:Uncharacterized protein n=1 Tax=Cymbomonas tetramitiformis TaxID=36881 RepID=A0AAE0GZT3_9CHLO|nr:hypothetical protein CYMTET_5137 [Cymbomonas tetramitiformis]
MKLDEVYHAKIEHRGQCRDRLDVWRGIWTFGISYTTRLECSPQDDADDEDDADDGPPMELVLTHRLKDSSTSETRWYGSSPPLFSVGALCLGETAFTRVAADVPICTPLNASIETIPLEQSPTRAPHEYCRSWIHCEGYIMLGQTGNAVHGEDNCIRLDLREKSGASCPAGL